MINIVIPSNENDTGSTENAFVYCHHYDYQNCFIIDMIVIIIIIIIIICSSSSSSCSSGSSSSSSSCTSCCSSSCTTCSSICICINAWTTTVYNKTHRMCTGNGSKLHYRQNILLQVKTDFIAFIT